MASSPTAGSNSRAQVVDTALAALYEAHGTASAQISAALESAHSRLGERPVYRSRHQRSWPTTNPEAEALLRQRLAAGEIKPWDVDGVKRLLTGLDAAREKVERLNFLAYPLNEEYARVRWSRFFLVTSSAGGHIHRDMSCSTCHPSTRYGWLPELSGLTEADAVAAQGPRLCSVCFPTAPMEWTVGEVKEVDPRVCPGSGQPARQNSSGGPYFCAVCRSWVRATSRGLAPRHHKPKS